MVVMTEKGVLLASGTWSPGTLSNILQCIGQAPTAKNDPAPDVSSAEGVPLMDMKS